LAQAVGADSMLIRSWGTFQEGSLSTAAFFNVNANPIDAVLYLFLN
jgi:hypothetical protein